jgi:thiol:disulfide interchange protein DsbD
MGSAIGFAVLVAPGAAFAVFTALGLGMAAPYVALVFFPGALRFLPRPGRWMETMRQLMAFPLFATVLWLLWVLAAQRGTDGVTRALAALLTVGFGAWLLGRFGEEPGRRRKVAGATVVIAAVVAIWLVVPSADERAAAGDPAHASSDVAWIEWDPGIVERLRAEGRPVYVDFTARWCLTCQVNKKVVFGSADVLRTLAEREVALVRADWTSQDPRITRALAQYGRNGVPLNVYFPPGPDSEPRVLPSVLSPGIVLDAIGS